MSRRKKFDSESFTLEIAGRPTPGNISLGKLVKEIIQNTLALEDLPKYRYPLPPEWEQTKTILKKRNDRLYKELDRREQLYIFGKDNNREA